MTELKMPQRGAREIEGGKKLYHMQSVYSLSTSRPTFGLGNELARGDDQKEKKNTSSHSGKLPILELTLFLFFTTPHV